MAHRSSTNLTGNTGVNRSITVPAGAAADDIAVLVIQSTSSGAAPTSTGFTLKDDQRSGGTRTTVLWKRLTGADSGTYAFTMASSTDYSEAFCVLLSGRVTTGDPFTDTTVNTEAGVNSSNIVCLGVTAAAGDDLIATAMQFNGGSWTPPSGMTERYDVGEASSAATLDAVSAGATGDKTFTVSGGPERWVGFLGAVAAASGGGGPSPETLYADASDTGTVTNPANATLAPNGTFTTDTGATSWTHRWTMQNPVNPTPVGTHTITLRVRKVSGQSGTPVVNSITLYNNTTSLGTIGAGSWNVTSGTGEDIQATFNTATLLAGIDPANLRVEVVTTAAGGNPSTRTPVQIDGITWAGDFEAAGTPGTSTGAPGAARGNAEPGAVAAAALVAGVPSAARASAAAGSASATAPASTAGVPGGARGVTVAGVASGGASVGNASPSAARSSAEPGTVAAAATVTGQPGTARARSAGGVASAGAPANTAGVPGSARVTAAPGVVTAAATVPGRAAASRSTSAPGVATGSQAGATTGVPGAGRAGTASGAVSAGAATSGSGGAGRATAAPGVASGAGAAIVTGVSGSARSSSTPGLVTAGASVAGATAGARSRAPVGVVAASSAVIGAVAPARAKAAPGDAAIGILTAGVPGSARGRASSGSATASALPAGASTPGRASGRAGVPTGLAIVAGTAAQARGGGPAGTTVVVTDVNPVTRTVRATSGAHATARTTTGRRTATETTSTRATAREK